MTKKMSLVNIQGKLSRNEMKKIMAGSGGCNSVCTERLRCTLHVGGYGNCHMPTAGANAGRCFCVAVFIG